MRTRSRKETAQSNQNSGIAANRRRKNAASGARFRKTLKNISDAQDRLESRDDDAQSDRPSANKRVRHDAVADPMEITPSTMNMMKQLVEKIVEMQSKPANGISNNSVKTGASLVTESMPSQRQRRRRKRTMTSKMRAALAQRNDSNGNTNVSSCNSSNVSAKGSNDVDMTEKAPAKSESAVVAKKQARKSRKKPGARRKAARITTTTAPSTTPSAAVQSKKKKRESRQERVKPTFDMESLSATQSMGVLKRKDGKPSKKANPKRQWSLLNGPLIIGENEPKLGETVNCVGYGVYCWFARKQYMRKGQVMPAKREFRKLRCKPAIDATEALAVKSSVSAASIPKPKPKVQRKKQKQTQKQKQKSPKAKDKDSISNSGSSATAATAIASKKAKAKGPKASSEKERTPVSVSKRKLPTTKDKNKTNAKTASVSIPVSRKRKRSVDLSNDDSETDVESPREDAFDMEMAPFVTPVKVEGGIWSASAQTTTVAHPKKRMKKATKQLAWDQMDAYIGSGSSDVGTGFQQNATEAPTPLLMATSLDEIDLPLDQPALMSQESFDHLVEYLNDDTPLPAHLAHEASTTNGPTHNGIKFESGLAKLWGKADNRFNREPYAQWGTSSFDDCGDVDTGLDSLFSFDDDIVNGLASPVSLVRSRSREMKNVAPWMQSAACRSYMSSK